ncbi:protein of unknown function; putative Fumarylacetoacetase domain [Blastococcus saxobsidens DD2]|uniref:Fumarylacetoacetase-like C-terminal domain-containing protein n=1 Tax=Blastococcus saxobsidens (strain DD2) TaxID=1146883 RepID=H6RKV1_BLASD|nr:protein of unknown function; putative Fumarylacetoacetase domain [Blastococcus saxobsidens DD2]
MLATVVGYSTFNDLTSRRAQKLTSQQERRQLRSGPLVPAAEVGDLRDGLRVQTRVNGETVQDKQRRACGPAGRRPLTAPLRRAASESIHAANVTHPTKCRIRVPNV